MGNHILRLIIQDAFVGHVNGTLKSMLTKNSRNDKFCFVNSEKLVEKKKSIYEENLEYLLRPRRLRGDKDTSSASIQHSGYATDAIGCPWRSSNNLSSISNQKLCYTCNIRYSDYGKYKICERCNRHWQIYNCHWPLKK